MNDYDSKSSSPDQPSFADARRQHAIKEYQKGFVFLDPSPIPLRVVLLTTTNGSLHLNFVTSILEALRLRDEAGPVIVEAWLPVVNGPYMDDGRNRAVIQALSAYPNLDAVLFIDDDVEFTNADITELVTAGVDIGADVIGGAYKGYNPAVGEQTIAYRWDSKLPPGSKMRAVAVSEVEAGVDPIPVDIVGTGFLCIFRHTLDILSQSYEAPRPWFDEPVYERTGVGEDVGFGLRCKDLGLKTYLHRGVRLVHYKTVDLRYS